MHNTDFIVDLDTTNNAQVASPRALDIGIEDGVQTFPKPATSESGNRLIIFTGTAICGVAADGDGERSLGVVRIRLNFPLSNTLHFIGSATVAALASVHGDDPEEALFAVDAAQTIVAPATEEAFRTTDFLQMTSTSFSMRRRWAPIRISTALHIRRTFS